MFKIFLTKPCFVIVQIVFTGCALEKRSSLCDTLKCLGLWDRRAPPPPLHCGLFHANAQSGASPFLQGKKLYIYCILFTRMFPAPFLKGWMTAHLLFPFYKDVASPFLQGRFATLHAKPYPFGKSTFSFWMPCLLPCWPIGSSL